LRGELVAPQVDHVLDHQRRARDRAAEHQVTDRTRRLEQLQPGLLVLAALPSLLEGEQRGSGGREEQRGRPEEFDDAGELHVVGPGLGGQGFDYFFRKAEFGYSIWSCSRRSRSRSRCCFFFSGFCSSSDRYRKHVAAPAWARSYSSVLSPGSGLYWTTLRR